MGHVGILMERPKKVPMGHLTGRPKHPTIIDNVWNGQWVGMQPMTRLTGQ